MRLKYDEKTQRVTNSFGAIICECNPSIPELSSYSDNYKIRLQEMVDAWNALHGTKDLKADLHVD